MRKSLLMASAMSAAALGIRMTPAERSMGRLMRAPDHDAGGGDGGAAGAAGADAGAGADTGAAAGGEGGDKGESEAAGDSDAGQSGAADDAGDGTVLGGAKAKSGDGDAGSDAGTGDAGQGDGADKSKDGESATDGPPETYELTPVKITGDDGNEVEIEVDQALLTEATPIFKEAGLTNEQAQQLAPLAVKVEQRVLQRQADDWAGLKKGWVDEAMKDKEIGGTKWAETEALCGKALDTFGATSVKDDAGKETNPFRVLLNESGVGNHPEFIRMFRRIGEKLGEDPVTQGDGSPAKKVDRLEALYPNDVPQSQKQGAK